jgi:hypothetical protein
MLEYFSERERLAFVLKLCNQAISPLAVGLQLTECEINPKEDTYNLHLGRRLSSFSYAYVDSYDMAA